MKLIQSLILVPVLVCAAVSTAVPGQPALAADAIRAQISVSGLSHGYTNEELRRLIALGVESSLADDRSGPTQWVFSVAPAAGNHPATQIVATLRTGNTHTVSGFFTSSALGTAPSSVFVEEVRAFASRLLRA